MKTLTKILGLGAVAAAGVGGFAAVRAIRAKRAEQQLEVSDLDDIGDIDNDFVDPVVVAEEVVIITDEPYDVDMDAVPSDGFSPGSR